MSNILVSIVIPTYKRPQALPMAIDSVLNQSFQELEVIVVDDNNPDTDGRLQTEAIMAKYENDKRVKYIKHPYNKNGSAARNTGIKAAEGKYIALLDDDDIFMPSKIEAQFERLESLDESWAACYTKYEIRNGNKLVSKGVENKEGSLLNEALMRNLFLCAGSNLMIRKSVLEEINGFDESFKRNQDLELLVRILQNYKIAHCDIMGLVVNEHIGNKVDFEQVTAQYLQAFDKYINQLPQEEQSKIHKMIDLQRFRYWFFRRKIGHSWNIYRTTSISFKDIAKYMIHLLKRYINKESIGFQL